MIVMIDAGEGEIHMQRLSCKRDAAGRGRRD